MMISIKLISLCIVAILLSNTTTVIGEDVVSGLYPPSWFKITKVKESGKNFDISFEFQMKNEFEPSKIDGASEIALLVQPPSSLKFVKETTKFAVDSRASKDKIENAYYFQDKQFRPKTDNEKCKFESWTYAAFNSSIDDNLTLAAGIFKYTNGGLDAEAGDVSTLSNVKYKNIIPGKLKKKIPEGTYSWTGTYEPVKPGTGTHFSKASHDWVVALAIKGSNYTIEKSKYKGCIGTDVTSAKIFFDQAKKDKYALFECGGLYEYDNSIPEKNLIYNPDFLTSITYKTPSGAKRGGLEFKFSLKKTEFPQIKDATHSTLEIIFPDVFVSREKLRNVIKREHLCGTIKLQTGVEPVAVSCQYFNETGTLLLKTDESKPLKVGKDYTLDIDTSRVDHLLPESVNLSLVVTSYAKPKDDSAYGSKVTAALTKDKFQPDINSNPVKLVDCQKKVTDLYKDAHARIIKAKAELLLGHGSKKVQIDSKSKTRLFAAVLSLGETHMIQLYVPRNSETKSKLITVKLTLEKDGTLKKTTKTIRHRLYPSLNVEYPSTFKIAPKGKSLELQFKDDAKGYQLSTSAYYMVPIVFDYSGNVKDLSADGVLKIEILDGKKAVKIDITTLYKVDDELDVDASKSYHVEKKNIKIEPPHVVTTSNGVIRVYVDFKTIVTKKMTFSLSLDSDILTAEKVKGVLRSRNSGEYKAQLKGKNTMEVTIESAALNDYRDKFSFALEFDASLKSKIEQSTMTVKVNALEVNKPTSFNPTPVGVSFIDGTGIYKPYHFPNTKTKGVVYEKSYKLNDIMKQEKNDWIPCISKRHQFVEVPISNIATAVYYYTRVVDCMKPWLPPTHTKINKGYRLGSSEALEASTEDLITIGLPSTEDGKYNPAQALMKEGKLFRNTLYVLLDKSAHSAINLEFIVAGFCRTENMLKCNEWKTLMKYFVKTYQSKNDDVVFHDIVLAYYNDDDKTLELVKIDEALTTGDVFASSEKIPKVMDFKTALDNILYQGYAYLNAQDIKGTFSVFVVAKEAHVEGIKKKTREYGLFQNVASKKGDLKQPIWIEIVPIKDVLGKNVAPACKVNSVELTNATPIDKVDIGKTTAEEFWSLFFNMPKDKLHSNYIFNDGKPLVSGPGMLVPNSAHKDLYEVFVNYQEAVDEICGQGTPSAQTGILRRFQRAVSDGMKNILATFKVFSACVHSDDVAILKKGAYISYRGLTATKFLSMIPNVVERSPVDNIVHDDVTCGPMSLYDNVPTIAIV